MANASASPVNLTGSHGNSKIVHPNGRVVIEAGHFQERLVSADLNLEEATGNIANKAVGHNPLLSPWLWQGLKLVQPSDSQVENGLSTKKVPDPFLTSGRRPSSTISKTRCRGSFLSPPAAGVPMPVPLGNPPSAGAAVERKIAQASVESRAKAENLLLVGRFMAGFLHRDQWFQHVVSSII